MWIGSLTRLVSTHRLARSPAGLPMRFFRRCLFVVQSFLFFLFFGTFINYLNLESLSKYRSAHRARLLTTTSSTTQRLDSYVNSFLISFCFLWPPRQPHLATVIVVRNLSTLRLEPILLVDIPSNMTESFHK